MGRIDEEYGTLVFNDHIMQERLPRTTYKALSKTLKEGEPLDIDVANVVAHAMKEWAVVLRVDERVMFFGRDAG